MSISQFYFASPWFLLLLLVLPLVWSISMKSLAGLGPIRRWLALFLRTALIVAIVFAMAGVQLKQTTQRVTVFYLLDQSESIPADKRRLMLDYVTTEVSRHRNEGRQDRAGLIIFGGQAKVEFPANDSDIPNLGRFEAALDLRENSTNLESALKLAKANFPDDSAHRVVIISDGNQNAGDALPVATEMAGDGVGIDVVPVQLLWDQDVSVEQVIVPANLRKGQNYEARVVLKNNPPTKGSGEAAPVKGKLRLIKRVGRIGAAGDADLLSESEVTLDDGLNVFSVPLQADESALVNIEAVFEPDEGQPDDSNRNNQAGAFTNVQGKGRALLIEDSGFRGEFETLVGVLRRNEIAVDVVTTETLFNSLDELVPYDLIIMANLPRSGGETADAGFSFTEEQIQMLVDATERMGVGLLMLGGDRSFGAGGWNDTALEDALPVELEIRNDKVAASGALVIIMHACETPNGNHWQKVIAKEAIKVLGPIDYCGLLRWDNMRGVDNWLWRLPNGVDRVTPTNKARMMGLLGRMNAGDMPNFDPAMNKAAQGLVNVPASAKHMIIISDGDPSAPSNAVMNKFINNKIVISTVAVGAHGVTGHATLRKIAQATGGKYYKVTNNRALPRIFQQEARKVTKPLIYEPEGGVQIVRRSVAEFSPMLRDVDTDQLPPFKGYVFTTRRKSELVDQLLVASKPDDGGENSTILSTWQYGLGRATVFTSDAGHRWTGNWVDSDTYEKLFTQMARQTMRNVSREADFQLATQQKGGKTEVLVTATDEEGRFVNQLNMQSTVMTPEGPKDLSFQQIAPGRYTASFESDLPGNYVLSVFPDEGYRRLAAGLVIPKSSEFNQRETNEALLGQLAGLKPKDGESGRVLSEDLSGESLDRLLEEDTFANTLRRAIRLTDIWHWIAVLASLTLFVDVFNRRVSLDWSPVGRFIGNTVRRWKGKEISDSGNRMERLKARKSDVHRERQEGKRFEVDESEPLTQQEVIDTVRSAESTTRKPTQPTSPSLKEEEKGPSYTDRLLEAKRRARKDSTDEPNSQ